MGPRCKQLTAGCLMLLLVGAGVVELHREAGLVASLAGRRHSSGRPLAAVRDFVVMPLKLSRSLFSTRRGSGTGSPSGAGQLVDGRRLQNSSTENISAEDGLAAGILPAAARSSEVSLRAGARFPWLVAFAGISAVAAVVSAVVSVVVATRSASTPQPATVITTCNDCCVNCAGNAAMKLAGDTRGGPRYNGCSDVSCLCDAAGPGVVANIFDPSCGSFRNCDVRGGNHGPVQQCGPGTLFNPRFNVCDWPANVRCVLVEA